MLNMVCDKCGTVLTLDLMVTAGYYDSEIKELYGSDLNLCINSEPNYVVYVCNNCFNAKKVDFRTMVSDIKNNIYNIVSSTRTEYMAATADRGSLKEENGISFCGICKGSTIDTGYCYNDIMDKCNLREYKLNEN